MTSTLNVVVLIVAVVFVLAGLGLIALAVFIGRNRPPQSEAAVATPDEGAFIDRPLQTDMTAQLEGVAPRAPGLTAGASPEAPREAAEPPPSAHRAEAEEPVRIEAPSAPAVQPDSTASTLTSEPVEPEQPRGGRLGRLLGRGRAAPSLSEPTTSVEAAAGGENHDGEGASPSSLGPPEASTAPTAGAEYPPAVIEDEESDTREFPAPELSDVPPTDAEEETGETPLVVPASTPVPTAGDDLGYRFRVQLGYRLLERGLYADAAGEFQQAVALTPDPGAKRQLYEEIGNAFRLERLYGRAMAAYLQAAGYADDLGQQQRLERRVREMMELDRAPGSGGPHTGPKEDDGPR